MNGRTVIPAPARANVKERPILFSAPMVRALLDGTKTQTRRVVKPAPEPDQVLRTITGSSGLFYAMDEAPMIPYPAARRIRWDCQYGGRQGDCIWVRETFFAYGRWVTQFSAKKARDEWHFIDMTAECGHAYQYAADNPDLPLEKGRGGATPGWRKRPAIHMPRAASRILLGIVSVRVERLQAITLGDICKEGLAKSIYEFKPATDGFRVWTELWESINGAGSWAANPWCWVLEFRRVQP